DRTGVGQSLAGTRDNRVLEVRFRTECEARVSPVRAEGDEAHVYFRIPPPPSQDLLQHLGNRVPRLHSAAHVVDDAEAPADLHDLFAFSGGGRTAHSGKEVKPRADDRRIAHAPGELEPRTAGAAPAGHQARPVDGEHANRVVA